MHRALTSGIAWLGLCSLAACYVESTPAGPVSACAQLVTARCDCGGNVVTSGYCCDGIPQVADCAELLPCSQGAVTSDCMCGGIAVTNGFCCADVPQVSACATTPICDEGAVISECDCGGDIVTTGYCCADVPQVSACATTPICDEGAVTSECVCGGAVVTSGYCCADVPQASICGATGVTDVSLEDATVEVGGTVEVGATILPGDALRTDVEWSTSAAGTTAPGVAGGDATNGTITTDGLYSPPASPLVGAKVYKVWAVSKANSAVRDFGWISVTDSSVPTCGEGAVASECVCGGTVVTSGYCCAETPQASLCGTTGVTYVYLENATVEQSGTVQIAVTIQPTNALRTDLEWSTSAAGAALPGVVGGDASNGTITADGVYSPPASPLIGTRVYKVWAVSKANSTVRDFCWISVTADICNEGAVSGECVCGGTVVTSGYCCSEIARPSICGTTDVTYVYLQNATVEAGGLVQIGATIEPANALRTDMEWSTSAAGATLPGVVGGDATNGAVTADGVYSPPASPLIGTQVYKAWAVSKADSTVRDYCWISVTADSLPICNEGAVTSECDCGGTVVASGYCCAGTSQPSACGTTGVTYVYLQNATVEAGGTVQIAATIEPANALRTDLAWSTSAAGATLPGVVGGDAMNGTITAGGVYSPPASPLVGTQVYKVWAVSKANPAVQDFCWISVTADSVPTCNEGAVGSECVCGGAVVTSGYCCAETPQPSPCSTSGVTYVYLENATVESGETVQITATIQPASALRTDLEWSTSAAGATLPGVVGGDATNGAVTTDGVYSPPASPLVGARVYKVWAVSKANSTVRDFCWISVTQGGSSPNGDYPFQGYTQTRGAFESTVDGGSAPRILIVDSLSGSSVGNESTGRGSLPWALTRSFPRVILFEVSGVINVGGTLQVTWPYVSVHGQTAPSPGITLYDLELAIRTHDVIFQHLRVRMGNTNRGGGDPLTILGASGNSVHDIIIDHCSSGLGHDEQLSISACMQGDVDGVTLSNNLLSFGLTSHNYGTLIESGDNDSYDVDGVLVDGNLYSQLSFRTPMVNVRARRVIITNNVSFNATWTGMHFGSSQTTPDQFIDVMNNLYWRGPDTETVGMWPTDEVSTWPAQPDLWPWSSNRRPISDFTGPRGSHTHIYFVDNYDYVNGDDYTFGNHEGRPVEIAYQRFYDGKITAADVTATERQTSLPVRLMTPAELETHVLLDVGCRPSERDPIDTLAVSDAFARTVLGGDSPGYFFNSTGDIGVAPTTSGSNTRGLSSIGGYPGDATTDTDADGLTDLEEWIYGL